VTARQTLYPLRIGICSAPRVCRSYSTNGAALSVLASRRGESGHGIAVGVVAFSKLNGE
jgi:hypothetical protein